MLKQNKQNKNIKQIIFFLPIKYLNKEQNKGILKIKFTSSIKYQS